MIFSSKTPRIAKLATERGYPKTLVLFFHEFVLFWGLGPLHGKIVSDGEVVRVKEQVPCPGMQKFARAWRDTAIVQETSLHKLPGIVVLPPG